MQGWEGKETEIRVALLHVPRYPTDYVIAFCRADDLSRFNSLEGRRGGFIADGQIQS